jgi:hypothetical protein
VVDGHSLTFLTVNARMLLTKKDASIDKLVGLQALLKLKGWPDVVVVTEVNGRAGRTSNLSHVFDNTCPDISDRYHAHWSFRSCSKKGEVLDESKLAGGGVAILTSKRLHLKSPRMELPPLSTEDSEKLNGHLMVLRFDPTLPRKNIHWKRVSPIQRPLIIAAGYIPPANSEWSQLTADTVLNTLEVCLQRMADLRRNQNAFCIAIGHWNACLGSEPVELHFENSDVFSRLQTAPLTLPTRFGQNCSHAETLLLKRIPHPEVGDADARGRRILSMFAKHAMCPLPGLFENLPTSWTLCSCQPRRFRCGCKLNRMRKCHDVIFIPSSVALDALLHPRRRLARYHVDRLHWTALGGNPEAPFVDHAVTAGRVWIDNRQLNSKRRHHNSHAVGQDTVLKAAKQRLRLKLSTDKLLRCNQLKIVCESMDTKFRGQRTQAQLHEYFNSMNLAAIDTVLSDSVRKSSEEAIKQSMTRSDGVGAGKNGQQLPGQLKVLWRHRNLMKERVQQGLALAGELTTANNMINQIMKQRQRQYRIRRAKLINRLAFSDPNGFWKLLKENARDPGRPDSDQCKLLEQITDSSGTVVATDPDQIRAYLVNWWTDIFKMSDKLSDECKQHIRTDVDAIHRFCCELSEQVSELSAVAKLSIDPFLSIPDTQIRDEIRGLEPTSQNDSSSSCSAAPSTSPRLPNDVELQAELSRDEIDEAMRSLEASGPGVDGVPPEALRSGSRLDAAFDEIVKLFNLIFRTGVIPQKWQAETCIQSPTTSTVTPSPAEPFTSLPTTSPLQPSDSEPPLVPLEPLSSPSSSSSETLTSAQPEPEHAVSVDFSWETNRLMMRYKGKGSDPFCVANYRPLGVGVMLSKLYSLVLLRRLERFVEKNGLLHQSQFGFRPGRGPHEAIFTLSESVRAAAKRNQDKLIYLLFVDLENAYGSINHAQLWSTLLRKGIGGRFLASLMALYNSASATLDVNGQLFGCIPIQRGVLQGNPLSPLLFNLFLDDVIRDLAKFGQSEMENGHRPLGIPLPMLVPSHQTEPSLDTATPSQIHNYQQSHQSEKCICPRCGFIICRNILFEHMADGRSCKSSRPGAGSFQYVRGRRVNATQDDWLSSQWFADDGVGISCDHDQMQRLIDWLIHRLEMLGLVLNASKTKVMVVPPSNWSSKQYEEEKARVVGKGFYAKSTEVPIQIVDSFLYLGAKLWWRWDWTEAWAFARRRAWSAFYQLRSSGFSQEGASLASQLRAVNALVVSHLDYIASIAGVPSKSELEENESIVTAALKLVAGNSRLNSQMLRMESGTWDQQTRIQMLQLRFACKISLSASASPQSPHYRAFRLSVTEYASEQSACSNPSGHHSQRPWRRMWAQSLRAAADSFQLPHDASAFTLVPIIGRDYDNPPSASPSSQSLPRSTSNHPLFDAIVAGSFWPAAILVRVDRSDLPSPFEKWNEVHVNDRGTGCLFRLRSADGQYVTNYATGATESHWIIPEGERKDALSACSNWNVALRTAIFASLRFRGNRARAKLVNEQLEFWKSDQRAGRSYVIWKSASYLEPYWFLDDIVAARRLMMARFDDWGNEYSYRRAVHGSLQRLQRHQRACYLCQDENAWMPESLEHLLLRCQHPELVQLRLKVRSDLQICIEDLIDVQAEQALDRVATENRVRNHQVDLSDPPTVDSDPVTILQIAEDSVRSQAPNLELDDVFLTVLMCCTGGGSTIHRPHPADLGAPIEVCRQRPEVALSQERLYLTANWLRSVMSIWPRAVATGTLTNRQALLSQKLLSTIARHSQGLYAIRRKLLRNNEAFNHRHRDPSLPMVIRPSLLSGGSSPAVECLQVQTTTSAAFSSAASNQSMASLSSDATDSNLTNRQSSRRPKRTRTS